MAVLAHVRKISLVTTNGGDNHCKNNRFNKAVGYITHNHVSLDAVQVNAAIQTQKHNRGNIAADNADEVKHSRQQGKADDGRGNFGADEIPDAD